MEVLNEKKTLLKVGFKMWIDKVYIWAKKVMEVLYDQTKWTEVKTQEIIYI